jgi:hypothetical protein
LEAAQGHAYEHLYAFLLATGLRLGEALALRWQEDGQVLVDLDGRHAMVKYTLDASLRGMMRPQPGLRGCYGQTPQSR